ncbi:MAG: Kae1-associated kinase Bud32 [Candidatus Hodarchaeota archaeon]
MDFPADNVFKKGAEATLYKGTWFSLPVLYKVRVKKAYRHPVLDEKIRSERTANESRIMENLLFNGIPVPCIYEVDVKDHYIVMEYMSGKRLKDVIPLMEEKLEGIFMEIGKHVARMHDIGIIHGDLTTSNIIHYQEPGSNECKLTFIDFGLSKYSVNVEDKSVDIHLFKRVITSTHIEFFDQIFPAFLKGYEEILVKDGKREKFNQIIKRLEKIETRGRYVEKRKRK